MPKDVAGFRHSFRARSPLPKPPLFLSAAFRLHYAILPQCLPTTRAIAACRSIAAAIIDEYFSRHIEMFSFSALHRRGAARLMMFMPHLYSASPRAPRIGLPPHHARPALGHSFKRATDTKITILSHAAFDI